MTQARKYVPLLAIAAGLVATSSSAAHGRSTASQAAAPIVFKSPSGNIRCRYFPSASTIGCLMVNNGIEAIMSLQGRPYAQKKSHSFLLGPTLGYGHSRGFAGQFKCTSRKDGMLCKSLATGRCFLATRTGPRLTCAPQGAAAKPKPTRNCHPSYVGACLDPNASDYDCAGGSGNGPYYTGPVRVVGPDDFDLDRDGDGYACEG